MGGKLLYLLDKLVSLSLSLSVYSMLWVTISDFVVMPHFHASTSSIFFFFFFSGCMTSIMTYLGAWPSSLHLLCSSLLALHSLRSHFSFLSACRKSSENQSAVVYRPVSLSFTHFLSLFPCIELSVSESRVDFACLEDHRCGQNSGTAIQSCSVRGCQEKHACVKQLSEFVFWCWIKRGEKKNNLKCLSKVQGHQKSASVNLGMDSTSLWNCTEPMNTILIEDVPFISLQNVPLAFSRVEIWWVWRQSYIVYIIFNLIKTFSAPLCPLNVGRVIREETTPIRIKLLHHRIKEISQISFKKASKPKPHQ